MGLFRKKKLTIEEIEQARLENKINFLTDLYNRMQPGAYLIIGETFIEEGASTKQIEEQFEATFYNNSKDVFWNSLNGLEMVT